MKEAHTPSEIFSFAHGADASRLPLPGWVLLPQAETLDKSRWRVVDASSESSHNGKTGDKAIDGDPRNWWHSRWRDRTPGHPHHLTIDLGASQAIAGLRYLPRQDGETNGRVKAFEVYVSEDPQRMGSPVAQGRFSNDQKQEEARFPKPAAGRYVKFVILSGFGDDPHGAVAELDLLAAE
jgi:endo-alpha-N-acetylgalactosaminidase